MVSKNINSALLIYFFFLAMLFPYFIPPWGCLLFCTSLLAVTTNEALELFSKRIQSSQFTDYFKIEKDKYRSWAKNLPPTLELLQRPDFQKIAPNSTFDLLLTVDSANIYSGDFSQFTNMTFTPCQVCLNKNTTLFFEECGTSLCQDCYHNLTQNQNYPCPKCQSHHSKIFSAKLFFLNKSQAQAPFAAVPNTNFSNLINRIITEFSNLERKDYFWDRDFILAFYFLFSFDLFNLEQPWHFVEYLLVIMKYFLLSSDSFNGLQQLISEFYTYFRILDKRF